MMDTPRPYRSSTSMRIFQGALVSSGVLVLIELLHLWRTLESRSPQERYLTLIYGASLVLALGLSITFLLRGVVGLIEWGREGVEDDPRLTWALWGAMPITTATLGLCLSLALSLYPERDLINYNYSSYFWLLPCGAVAAYVGYISKNILYQFNQSVKGGWIIILSVLLTIVLFTLAHRWAPAALREQVMSWPIVAFLLAPTVLLVGWGLSFITPDLFWLDQMLTRVALTAFILSIAAIFDLSEHINQHKNVAQLLDQSRLSAAVIHALQPLFDQDGDGFAGKLGGADCDDLNPKIHPGAQDIPLNGIDEDCFGGDYIPPRKRMKIQEVKPSSRTQLSARVERPNIILITIDTLRADHLHYHGYRRRTSPFLDALSQRGLTFKWAFSTGAQTRISMPAVFIGRFYSEVSRSQGDWAEVYPDNLTLAERLRAEGYRTVGIPAHTYFTPNYGLHQGFEEWNLEVVERFTTRQKGVRLQTSYHVTGGAVTDSALRWIEERNLPQADQRPFFMWLHYFDPHYFYQDHPEINFGNRGSMPNQPLDLYDEEIFYTDRQISRLFESFERTPLAQNTYVMIHSDHGEAFKEHGHSYHGQSLHNNQVHVPLMLFGPQIPQREIQTPVSLIDVTPTLLELAQVPALSPEPRGSSLLKFAYQPRASHHPIMIEMLEDSKHSEQHAIVSWPWKLIRRKTKLKRFEMFNLREDPMESLEVSIEGSSSFRRLHRRLNRFLSEETEPLKPRTRYKSQRSP